MKIKAIVFDLDDTLIPSTEIYKKALKTVGLSNTHPAYAKARITLKKRLGESHPASHNRLLYFKEMDEKTAYSRMEKYEKSLGRLVYESWHKLQRPALFQWLSARYRLAIVSNENTRTQLLKLRAMDPHERYFSTLVTSEEVGVEKPNLVVFREVYRRLRVAPSQSLMVGDDLKRDILPARKLGAKTMQIVGCDLTPLKALLNELR